MTFDAYQGKAITTFESDIQYPLDMDSSMLVGLYYWLLGLTVYPVCLLDLNLNPR